MKRLKVPVIPVLDVLDITSIEPILGGAIPTVSSSPHGQLAEYPYKPDIRF